VNSSNFHKVLEADRYWSAQLQVPAGGLQRVLALTIAHTGDSLTWALIAVWLWYTSQVYASGAIAITALLIAFVVTAIKLIVRRHRPNDERRWSTMTLDRHSFPSGHAARSIGLAIVLSAFVPNLEVWLLAWAIAVGLARIALGVHYLSDVIAGWGLGLLFGLILLRFL
jgi:undecaprenyl-diphosphatase